MQQAEWEGESPPSPLRSKQFDIIGAVEDKNCPEIGKDAGILAGCSPINVKISADFPPSADIIIDFSLPAAADSVIDYCVKNKSALVMGTTGLSAQQLKKIDEAAKKIAVIQATNMSVGMNLLFEIVGQVAAKLGDEYDIEIVEAHHRLKKDAPSGSAMTLAEKMAAQTNKKIPDCLDIGRKGKDVIAEKRLNRNPGNPY